MKMGLRKQQNLLHWLNKNFLPFFLVSTMQPPPPGKKKSPVSSIGPTDHLVFFFVFGNPLSPPFQYWSGNFFTTGSFAVCGNDRKLG